MDKERGRKFWDSDAPVVVVVVGQAPLNRYNEVITMVAK